MKEIRAQLLPHGKVGRIYFIEESVWIKNEI